MQEMRNSRILWIDLARTIAVLCVILVHAAEGVYGFSPEEMQAVSAQSGFFAFLCFTVGRLGVPLFLMISGYLLLDRDYDEKGIIRFWKDRWLHLLICTWIWLVIYEIFISLHNHAHVGLSTAAADLLFLHNPAVSHAWYMPMILGLYILIPFVSAALKKFDNRLLLFPLAVYGVYVFTVPLLTVTADILKPGLSLSNQVYYGFSGGCYGIYMVMGWLIRKGALKKYSGSAVTAVSAGSILLAVIFQIWAYSHDYAYKVWYDNLLILISSSGVFELLSRLQIRKEYRWIRIISCYSFAIYLTHNIFRITFLPYIKSMAVMMPAKVLIIYVISFALGLTASWLISRIPKAGRYILYLKN